LDIVKFGCWVISLDEQCEQAQTLLAALRQQGVEASVFHGVDGRQGIPSLEGREKINKLQSILRHQQMLTSSQVGCYLSHYRVISKAYDEGYDRICILEDDAILEDKFGGGVRRLIGLPEEYEMTRLMALKIRKRKVVKPLFDDCDSHDLVRPERGWCGAQGYLLSRSGMKKILDNGGDLFEPIDKLYDHFWEFDLKLYGVEPHLLYEQREESNIQKIPPSKPYMGIVLKIGFHLYKGFRSLKRHLYLNRFRNEFYPASKPKGRPGRTERMK
jgi:glycosyl transferase, family 25